MPRVSFHLDVLNSFSDWSTKIISWLVRVDFLTICVDFLTIQNSYEQWDSTEIFRRIRKVLEKIFWCVSIIKWVILDPKNRKSGCHVIWSRDNHVSKFEVPNNVGLSQLKLGHEQKFPKLFERPLRLRISNLVFWIIEYS